MFNGILKFSFPSPTLHKVTPYLDVLPFNSVLPMICLSMSLPTHLLFTLSSIATMLSPIIRWCAPNNYQWIQCNLVSNSEEHVLLREIVVLPMGMHVILGEMVVFPKVFLKEMCVFLREMLTLPREMLTLPREMLVFLMVVFLGKSMSSLEKCSMGRCLCSLGEIFMFPKVFWGKFFGFLCKWLCYLERCLCLLREIIMFPMEMFVFFMRDGYVSMKMFLLVVLLGEMPMFSQEMAKKWLCCLPEWHFFKF